MHSQKQVLSTKRGRRPSAWAQCQLLGHWVLWGGTLASRCSADTSGWELQVRISAWLTKAVTQTPKSWQAVTNEILCCSILKALKPAAVWKCFLNNYSYRAKQHKRLCNPSRKCDFSLLAFVSPFLPLCSRTCPFRRLLWFFFGQSTLIL